MAKKSTRVPDDKIDWSSTPREFRNRKPITLTLSDEEREALEAKADRAGVSPSVLVGAFALDVPPEQAPTVRSLVCDLLAEHIDGLTAREIAEHLEIDRATVQVSLSRGVSSGTWPVKIVGEREPESGVGKPSYVYGLTPKPRVLGSLDAMLSEEARLLSSREDKSTWSMTFHARKR